MSHPQPIKLLVDYLYCMMVVLNHLDSLARQQLLQIQGRLKLNDMSPVQWYLIYLTIPNFGSNLDIILVEHPFYLIL